MRRSIGLFRLGVRRIAGRLVGGQSRQIVLSIVGVALAIALMTSVSGIALNLSADTTVEGDDVDYWVLPETTSSTSMAVPVSGPKLGAVHDVTSRLGSDDRIKYTTPVLLRVIELQHSETETSAYVLAAGVIPPEEGGAVLGMPTSSLAPGDPYYANGSYNGTWSGEAVVSKATASQLNAEQGERLVPRGRENRTFAVTAINESSMQTGAGSLPLIVVHLAELQELTGATTGDQANQILVSTDSSAVKSEITNLYPHTTVVSRTGITQSSVSTSSLPLAVAVAALIASVAVGVLFVATMMGLEITNDRKQLATLGAIGFSTRSRSLLVLAETLTVAVVGGILGLIIGRLGIEGLNAAAEAYLNVETVAIFHPLLALYGLGISIVIGGLSALYPIWLSARTDVLEVLNE